MPFEDGDAFGQADEVVHTGEHGIEGQVDDEPLDSSDDIDGGSLDDDE
ncbi:MAG: hypothetical protein ACRDL7_13865 [Gaiellaceae bacterium]